ncbi:MAG: hypothetical protein PVG22_15965 [Chromatiales bacterium]|jgi:hypothetical protein
MIDILKKYNNGSFNFSLGQSLGILCNAPKGLSGVYIVYDSTRTDKPIYIGSSGRMLSNGVIEHRNDGLYGRIVNGKQFDKPRKISWPQKMQEQKINKLLINWYITFNGNIIDIPKYVEAVLLQNHFDLFNELPAWNKSF